MTPFPLLQLPLVAMENVLCIMDPFELIDVSLASSRTKRVVGKFSKTKKKFLIAFDNSDPSITIHSEQKSWKCAIKMNEIQASQYKKEPLKDIMKWFDHAREVLNCKIDKVTFYLGSESIENRETIDWIAAQGKTIDDMEIRNTYGEQSDDDLKYLMKRIHVSGTLSLINMKFRKQFRMEIPGKPKHLHIANSRFIDYEQLLRLKSPILILRQPSLTNQEINRFLKSWMSLETHLELEAFKISISGPNAMNQIMNLPHEKTNYPNLIEAFNDEPFFIEVEYDMFTIKRCDGKKRATVTVKRLWGEWDFYLIVH
uniref:F-box domain-containing protein n=1 Tax=Caenorhabditis tropicalis TaxID=1561998 RepID=A0A1I7UU37_9PELO